MDIQEVKQLTDRLTTMSEARPLSSELQKALSHCKLSLSMYAFGGDKALPEVQKQYSNLMDELYREFNSYAFYTDSPICNLLREMFDPSYNYVEPWGYEATY